MRSIGKSAAVFFSLFAFSLILFIASSASLNAAKFINREICQRIRGSLTCLTSAFDFSVFEAAVFLSPVLIFILIRYIIHGKEDILARFLRVVSVILILPSLYIVTVGISFSLPSSYDSYNVSVTENELFMAVNTVIDTVNKESVLISDEPNFDEIRFYVSDAFKKQSGESLLLPKPKRLISSRLVSYSGALAIYSFPTGEINVNTNAPAYTVPFTIAHEMAHFLGASCEADANFLSYLVLSKSDMSYARYSASLSVLEYMLADLKKANVSLYYDCKARLSERAISDIKQGIEYTEKYNLNRVSVKLDELNSIHNGIWDKEQGFSYGAVSVYVTNYLNSA